MAARFCRAGEATGRAGAFVDGRLTRVGLADNICSRFAGIIVADWCGGCCSTVERSRDAGALMARLLYCCGVKLCTVGSLQRREEGMSQRLPVLRAAAPATANSKRCQI